MTRTSNSVPLTLVPTPALATTLQHLSLAWGEALIVPVMVFAWSALRLWDYPCLRPEPGQEMAPPAPR